MKIPFNIPYMTGKELYYVNQAHQLGQLAGDGLFTDKCHSWLEETTGCDRALLTHSCTASLEMAALLADLKTGDEVIMPSYTFVSTANAFVLRGAVPVFVDIREDTLNIDENLIESAITEKTKAIVPVHYAGVGCEMDRICALAKKYDLIVIEDAAQGVMATYKGRPLGSIGDLGCYSFHETKNIISGEGGALLVNRQDFTERAEVIREKGTNRSQFFRGEVDKYTWVDVGSSYLPGEVIAAFLYAQMEKAEKITRLRCSVWDSYHNEFLKLEDRGNVRRPIIPTECEHNAHLYYLLTGSLKERDALLAFLRERGVYAVFHYVPLHDSPAGKKYARQSGSLENTEMFSARLLRLPLYPEFKESEYVVDIVSEFYS